MVKITALVVLFIAAAALVSASAYSMEESERCEREMRQQMPMRQCMMYMQKRMRSPSSRRFREDADLDQCCSELRQFSSGCRCDAVSEMMKEIPQMERMERMACKLPAMCGMREDCGCASYFA